MMDESAYAKVVAKTLRAVENMFEDVDTDVVDVERSGDVMTFTFKDKRKAVLNTQRPTRQLWLAAGARAWHFDWDPTRELWTDDKGAELFSQIASITKDMSGVSLTPPT